MANVVDIESSRQSPAKERAARLRELANQLEGGSVRGVSLVYVDTEENIVFLHGFDNASEILAWSEALHDDAKLAVWSED